MKTIIVSIVVLTASLAFAAPASAQCVDTPTGGFACAHVEGPSSVNAYVIEPGVAAASVSRGEYSFFGMMFRDTHVHAATYGEGPAGYNSVTVSEFCMGNAEGCTFQENSVVVYTGPTGVVYASLVQTSEGRFLCTPDGCQPF